MYTMNEYPYIRVLFKVGYRGYLLHEYVIRLLYISSNRLEIKGVAKIASNIKLSLSGHLLFNAQEQNTYNWQNWKENCARSLRKHAHVTCVIYTIFLNM